MSDEDKRLIDMATKLLDERYAPPVHSVAAAIRTKSGEVITGVNIDHFTMFVCAETSALDEAINNKIYDIDTVVAVRKNADGETSVANMCGKCRQIFHDYAPGVKVIVTDHEQPMVKTIDELLPFSFKRQQEKIHTIIEGIERS
jgi:cytidine deaminase